MKNALIWGATGAIGQACLKKLNAEGWTTIGIARDASTIENQANFILETPLDEPHKIEQTIYLVSQQVGEIALWIYTAGDIVSMKVDEMEPQDWGRILSANLSGAYHAVHYSLPLLSENAHIFFVGAISERLKLPGLSAYAASKSGLEAFATALSKEQRKKLITVVRPGAVKTPFWEKVPMRLPANAASPEKVAEKIFEAYQTGHKGQLDLIQGS